MSKVKKHPHAGMSGARGAFVKAIHELTRSGHRNHREVFSDFLELSFCALAAQTHPRDSERGHELEKRYMRVVGDRDPEYIRRMPELLSMMAIALNEEPCDFLGSVAGELGALNEHMGQFFTPFHVSYLMAQMLLSDVGEVIKRDGHVVVGEPTCGSGGMVIAAAQVVRDLGFDPRKHMYVQAVDLSATAFQMAYVQLSACGIPADVIHGNSITLETFSAERTMAAVLFARQRALPPLGTQLAFNLGD
jgi:hypothetical protein